jgi:4-phytase/acid phosphatase
MTGQDLAWSRLNADTLLRVMQLHATYADLTRRTPEIARARGSNLLLHVLRSMAQAVAGKPMANALGTPQDAVLILSGHDTNLSNLSGMLGLSWRLPGYQPDDTPPGGALVFSLWQDPATRQYSVTADYIAQTLDQMRELRALTSSAPPAKQRVAIPGCDAVGVSGSLACSWTSFERIVEHAISGV